MNMTEPIEPDKKDETAESTEDEPIIDLKDEMAVDPADDEPIDLTEVAEESPAEYRDEAVEAGTDATAADESPTMPEEALKGDEEIIDLLQAVEEPIAKDPDETVFEDATEPTENQAPIALEEETADAAEEITLTMDAESVVDDVSVPAEDEAVIDLTDSAGETTLETEDIGEPISEDFDTAAEFDDISEIDNDLIQEATGAMDESNSETIVHDALKDDFSDSLGIELDSEEDAKENLPGTDKVTNEQVEAALERVIKKMFYEKIDRLLVDTIEKTVTREIERLKKALLDDATDSEK